MDIGFSFMFNNTMRLLTPDIMFPRISSRWRPTSGSVVARDNNTCSENRSPLDEMIPKGETPSASRRAGVLSVRTFYQIREKRRGTNIEPELIYRNIK